MSPMKVPASRKYGFDQRRLALKTVRLPGRVSMRRCVASTAPGPHAIVAGSSSLDSGSKARPVDRSARLSWVSIVSRKFRRRWNRSATCRACGAPSRAPCAYRPQRSRLTISTSGCCRSHSAVPAVVRSCSTSTTSRRSRSTIIVPYEMRPFAASSSRRCLPPVQASAARAETSDLPFPDAAEWCRR